MACDRAKARERTRPQGERLRSSVRFTANLAAALASAAFLSGCAGSTVTPRTSAQTSAVTPSPRIIGFNTPVPKGGGRYKLGRPYRIAGKLYVPRHEPNYDKVGIASWYGDAFHGRKTANGEIYDANALTAAHPTLPLPSYAYVTNLANGRTILVRINDRGPYVGNRIIDLSRRAATVLRLKTQGLGKVRVIYAGAAPLNGNDYAERKFLWSQRWSQIAGL